MSKMTWALVSAIVAGSMLAPSAGAVGPASAASKKCAKPSPRGAEWPSYGLDLSNSRDQTRTTIDRSNVKTLKGAWAISSADNEGIGSFQSTAVVAGGCMFAATTSGSIFAVDEATGEIVWHVFKQSDGGVLGGIYAPTVRDGTLYATVGRTGVPYAVALDASTGDTLWETNLYQGLADAELHLINVNASVVLFDEMVFVALAGTDSFNFSHPSFFILDAESGAILKKTVVIPQEDWLEGYSGGGIWGTAVVDTKTDYLFVGTANPYNKRREHAHTNSIVKIDMDQDRKTFGEIVDSYKGDKDYDPELYDSPECEYLGELQPVGFSTFCGQRDIDFGASPNLYKDSAGRTIVVNLQKSCTVHAVFADTMKRFWKRLEIGPGRGGAAGCASTTAYDDDALYVNVNEGVMFALDKDTGATIWKTVFKDAGPKYQPVSVANGVVYTVGNNGHLYAFDSSTGKVLLNEQLKAGDYTCSATAAGGVSVAGDTVYVECDVLEGQGAAVSVFPVGNGAAFAYRLPR